MTSIRRTAWFVALAFVLSAWFCVLGSLPAEAGVIPSRTVGGEDGRAADLAKVQALLERKVVLQALVDYGVSPEQAVAKLRTMSDKELHRLASLADRAAAGADSGADVVIGVAILVLLVLIILWLMNKRVVIR